VQGIARNRRLHYTVVQGRIMRTEIYSWRLSQELKSDLERKARLRKVPVSAVLESAVRDWLKKDDTDPSEDDAQRRLHNAAAICLGTIASGNPHRAETARGALRDRLQRRRAR
jgi:hypothetical protein